MRTLLWLSVLLAACGSDSKPLGAAGSGGVPSEDAGSVDAGPSYRGEGGAGASSEAGSSADVGGAGSSAAVGGAGSGGVGGQPGGSGGSTAVTSGAGAGGAGTSSQPPPAGTSAPTEHVLWSQSWTVEIHSAVANDGYKNATMGLLFDAGIGCRFGTSGSPSGETQSFPTDGGCVTSVLGDLYGSAVIYDENGANAHGSAGRAKLVGYREAVTGHRVTAIRRSQTYTIKLNGTGPSSYNYADFHGTWEALGF